MAVPKETTERAVPVGSLTKYAICLHDHESGKRWPYALHGIVGREGGAVEWERMARVPAALRALLTELIDYAGLYPPAALPLAIVEERYGGFRASPEAWMLNRLVLPVAKLHEARLGRDWRVALLVDGDPGPLPPQVETIETKTPGAYPLPVYLELPLDQIHGGFAKVRTGGLTPDAIPSAEALASFLHEAAARHVAFKATAGLHHPVRSTRPLTYAIDSPCAAMHGFLNVFGAAALVWHGMDLAHTVELIEERDPAALVFTDEHFVWSGHRVTTEQILEARREFAHSFGSCSFEEPVTELRALGLLP